jgi:hypothetical protein
MEPLPPIKEVEYRCIIGKAFDEITGIEYTSFSFETSKEFSSFRYEIAVRYRVEPGNIVFRVLGMTATRMMMPSFGTAKSVLKVPHLQPGVYTVTFHKSDGSESQFVIEYKKGGFHILKPIPRKRFIDIIILPEAQYQNGKILSTVTKTPHAPLVPRTIQKRQPTPPTPEELELLAALKSETPEERDAREEMELFGGRKKISKKDLAESEKELKKLGDKPTKKAKAATKKTAKQPKKAAPAKKAKPVAKKVAKPSKKTSKPAKKGKKK